MSIVVPAVLPSSRKEFEEELALFATLPSVSRVQIDTVDGKFATPASWPCIAPEELRARVARGEMLPALERIAYEIDLMCLDALATADAWLALGATRLTFHAESTTNLPGLMSSVRSRYGSFITLGLALNIETNLSLIKPCIGEIEYVQFMGIAHIGVQGQPFDERVLGKIKEFRTQYPDLPFQVDGGMTLPSAKKVLALGASNVVVGSAILRAKDPRAVVAAFEALQTSYGV